MVFLLSKDKVEKIQTTGVNFEFQFP